MNLHVLLWSLILQWTTDNRTTEYKNKIQMLGRQLCRLESGKKSGYFTYNVISQFLHLKLSQVKPSLQVKPRWKNHKTHIVILCH